MKVFVVSDGQVSNQKKFSAVSHQTPSTRWFSESHGYANRVIYSHGYLHTRAYDSTIQNYGPPSEACQNKCIADNFRNGDDVCDIYDRSEDENSKTVYEYGLMSINNSYGAFKCKLGGETIGYQNMTFTVTQDYGRSISSHAAGFVGLDGYVHDLLNFARIDSISTSMSGLNGGGILKISGEYFDTRTEAKKEVLIDSKSCEIISISRTLIECKIPRGTPTLRVTHEKYYPGGRGIERVIYSGNYEASISELEDYNLVHTGAGKTGWKNKAVLERYVEAKHERAWRYEEFGYSALSVFYFNPLLDSEYDLEYETTSGDELVSFENEVFDYTPKISNGHLATGQFGKSSEPLLIKRKVSEKPNSKNDYFTTRYYVRHHSPVLPDYENRIRQALSKSTKHNFNLYGIFMSEKQTVEIAGDRNLIQNSGLRLKLGDSVINSQINFVEDTPSTIVSAIKSTQGKVCPSIYRAPVNEIFYYNDYENVGNCPPSYFTTDDSFCGSSSIKISTSAGESKVYLFRANHPDFKTSCDGNLYPELQIDHASHVYGWMCFAYKGSMANRIKGDISYITPSGEYKIMENIPFWTMALDNSAGKQDTWKHDCIDLYKNWRWTMDYFQRTKHEFAQSSSFKIVGLFIEPKKGAPFTQIDHVSIQVQKSQATDKNLNQIAAHDGPIVSNFAIQNLSTNTYEIEMVPGKCSTGHKLIGFAGSDLIETTLSENSSRYRHPNWPSNTYIQIERTQKSASSVQGDLELKYDRVSQSVKLDIGADSNKFSMVNAFALAGMKVAIESDDARTCESYNFNVTYTIPAGKVEIPQVTLPNELVSLTSTELESGYERYLATMDWFLSAHKYPQVRVIFNDITSACEMDACDFVYSESNTPRITSISNLNNLVVGDQLVITGYNLKDLQIKTPRCDINEVVDSSKSDKLAENEYTIFCRINEQQLAGTFEVDIVETNLGRPDYVFSNATIPQVTVNHSLHSVLPENIVPGGDYISLFGTSLSCEMSVAIQGDQGKNFPCLMDSNFCEDPTEIRAKCLAKGLSGPRKIMINQIETNHIINFVAGPRLETVYCPSSDQYYSSVYKTQINTQKSVFLNADPSEGGFGESSEKLTIYLGDIKIKNFENFSSTRVALQIPILAPGNYPITAYIENVGFMVSSLAWL